MLITLDLFNAHPTEEYTTSPTYHFITTFNFLNLKFAVWTGFCALLNIVYIHLLLYLVYMLGFKIIKLTGIFVLI